MNVIRYSIGKLATLALFTGGMAGLFLWILVAPKSFMDFHGRYAALVHFIAENSWASGGLFALCFAGTALLLMMIVGDRTALALGPDGVEIRTTFGRHEAGWDRVAGIGIEKAGRLAGGGESVVVRLRQDIGEKRVRVSTGLLEQSRWEINRILETINRPGVYGSADPGVEGEAPPSMDYDAVIARHVARQGNAGEAAQRASPGFVRPQAASGGFGRKGL